MEGSQSAGSSENEEQTLVRELCANGICMKTTEVEAKLDEGNIQEAESSLREGLQLNFEEARALLGRLEYQRGNVEGALRVFDGIDLQAAIERLQPSIPEKQPTKKGRSRNDSQNAVSQHAAGLVLEAIYLKAKSLQKLGRLSDAANECKNVLDAVEKIFQQGIPDVQVDSRLQDTVSQAVELLPELEAGCGVEAGPLSLAAQIDGSYVPKQNLEEAVLLLMILIRKFYLGKTKWDPSVMEHLTFALSLCSQTSIVAKQLEEIMPGVFHRVDRWNTLALCYCGAGQNNVALNLLRNSLHKHERPNDLMALLLAAKICSEDSHLATEGGGYAQRAIENAQGIDEHLKGVAVRMLGLCLGKQAKVSSSDFERSRLQSEALKSLEALRYAKQFIDATGGSLLKGWRLLALVLSAQQRFSEAEVVTDAALDETAKWDQGPLLRLKAKLKISQSLPMDAIETYRYLLALVQARRKSFGPLRKKMMATHISSGACLSVFCQRKGIYRVRAVASESAPAASKIEEEKVKLGGSDLRVTRLGIGAWSWGDNSYWNNFEWDDRKMKDAKSAFETSVDCGITFFDTAEVYGSGEEFIKERKETDPELEVAIATKFAALPWRLGRQSVLTALKDSICHLGVSSVELYQLHWPGIWGNEGYLDGLGDAVEQGLVKAVGVSNYSESRLRDAYERLKKRGIPLASNQVNYSLIYRAPEENGVKAACDELGITLIAYSPIAQGALTGKYTPENLPTGPRSRIYTPEFLIKVALNWLIAQENVVPIPGAKTAEQAKEFVGALGWRLTSEEINELRSMALEIQPVIGFPAEKL
ncbi:hypothetical protein GH714_033871 [Hevea brasiliensis]|uniref:NADP-dependent oxidoreductase domain-containing protein n=1 Tax=Hevea brasiliensis TaxID=3981 RepID=A0A6A6LRJ4_HEVBR|nr:hypothetical protein GH714_033871 [Hevea brasiliensis]